MFKAKKEKKEDGEKTGNQNMIRLKFAIASLKLRLMLEGSSQKIEKPAGRPCQKCG